MTLEERIRDVREKYPDPMTQAQLGDAIGVGKSTAYKLVRDGIVPYEDLYEWPCHYHMIRHRDVIRYLEKKYAHASQDYIDAGRRCIAMLLWDEPEILTMKDIRRITGIVASATQKWVYSGKLKGFYYMHSIVVKKSDLINFMASPAYQDSNKRNIRTEAVVMAVSWYKSVTEKAAKGGSERHVER